MNGRALPLFALACLAGGCAALPSAPARPAVYDFGPGALAVPPAKGPALPPLVLQDVRAPAALDNPAVLYRLAYADARQLRPYAHARWSMPPAQLVRQRLREALNLTRPVIDPDETAAPLTLRIDLEEFSQLFDTQRTSSGLVRLRATLIEARRGADRPIAQRLFVVQRPAATADARGGVHALMSATDAAIEQLGAWLQQQTEK